MSTGAGAPTAATVRDDVRAWLAESWDPELSLAEWRDRLADSGWGCPTWPVEWHGRGLHPSLASVVNEEFRAATGTGMSLVAPTLLEHGSDDVKRRLLRPIVTGEHTWCQLFSEPGNGSDLAGLTTRADRDGDTFVVNGQKVWNTGAQKATYGMLLARTDWDVPKHRGITYFAFPMRQAGVEVRPLRQMNGYASFNEVFLTDAVVEERDVVGEVGEGWRVALTTLAHERGLATAEAEAYYRTYVWYPQRAGRPDLVAERAAAEGRAGDPVVRQHVAGVESMHRSARWTAERARAARALGRPPGAEGSIGKLASSDIARASARAHATIAGARAMLTGPESPAEGIVAEVLVSVPGQSIAGGTDEIQHNIIGERVLGLPKEPSVDTDRPYREVRTNRR